MSDPCCPVWDMIEPITEHWNRVYDPIPSRFSPRGNLRVRAAFVLLQERLSHSGIPIMRIDGPVLVAMALSPLVSLCVMV